MNWLLIVVLGIIGIFTYTGHREGFIKTMFSLFSLLIALVITVSVSPYVSKALQNNDNIKEYLSNSIAKVMETEKKNDSVTDQAAHIESLSIPQSLKKSLTENNNQEIYKAMAVNTFNDYIANYLSCVVINSISFFITFLITTILLSILANALNIISKIPIINGLNKTAGLFVGVFRGLVIVWILCIVLTMFYGTKEGQLIYGMINQSRLLSSIYNNNLLLKAITDIAKVLF